MPLTPQQEIERSQERPHETAPIKAVEAYTDDDDNTTNYDILLEGSSGFILSAENLGEADPPAVGDEITLYTRNWSTIIGVDLRGEPLYFKTKEEQDADHAKMVEKMKADKLLRYQEKKEQLDQAFADLPEVFQRRIQWFRDHNPDFRWDCEEYELSACVDAVKIAAKFPTRDDVASFSQMEWVDQREAVPDLNDGHSGNSFACAVRLAGLFVYDPLLVIAEHGALVPLVGCQEYGCAHPRPDDVEAAIAKLQDPANDPALGLH